MEIKILKKMKRYLELSQKFSKSESEVFPKDDIIGGSSIIGRGIRLNSSGIGSAYLSTTVQLDGRELYIDNGIVKAKDKGPVTRGEKIIAAAKTQAVISDEYDEFLKLRSQLIMYFNGVEALIEDEIVDEDGQE